MKCSLFTKICKKLKQKTFKTPFLVTVYLWSISAFFSSPIKKMASKLLPLPFSSVISQMCKSIVPQIFYHDFCHNMLSYANFLLHMFSTASEQNEQLIQT